MRVIGNASVAAAAQLSAVRPPRAVPEAATAPLAAGRPSASHPLRTAA